MESLGKRRREQSPLASDGDEDETGVGWRSGCQSHAMHETQSLHVFFPCTLTRQWL